LETTRNVLTWYVTRETRSTIATAPLKAVFECSGMTHSIRLTMIPQDTQHAQAKKPVTEKAQKKYFNEHSLN